MVETIRTLNRHGYAVTLVCSLEELREALRIGGFDLTVVNREFFWDLTDRSNALKSIFRDTTVVYLAHDDCEASLIRDISKVPHSWDES
jgi:hypothetical protein